MASISTTDLADTGVLGTAFNPSLLESEALREVRPALTSRGFIRFLKGGATNVAALNKYGDTGEAAVTTDGLDFANTALSDTSATVTAVVKGQTVAATDFLVAVAAHEILGDISDMARDACLETFEDDVAALMDDGTNDTVAAGALTPSDFLAAVSALEQADMPGPYHGYIHPQQAGELRNVFVTSGASYYTNDKTKDLVKPFEDQGYFGSVFNVPVWVTSCVDSASSQLNGAVFVAQRGIGGYIVRDTRVAMERDESISGGATEFSASIFFGVGVLDAAAIQGLFSAD
jgi:hypothetical protein